MKNRIIKIGLVLGIVLLNYWLEVIKFNFDIVVNIQ